MTDGAPTEKVIDSIHSSDAVFCVDVIRTSTGFALQICRRDEGRWQVINRPSEHPDREDALARARALIATFEERLRVRPAVREHELSELRARQRPVLGRLGRAAGARRADGKCRTASGICYRGVGPPRAGCPSRGDPPPVPTLGGASRSWHHRTRLGRLWGSDPGELMNTFADLGVRPRTLAVLTSQGINRPLPVQEQSIPPLLAGRDAVIQAPTGSGKTLTFLVPLAERLGSHRGGGPRALIIAPTRELVAQIASVARALDSSLRTAMLIGGVGYGPQLSALASDPDVVIGCPGRILDLAARGSVGFSKVQLLILDEADEMLDQGFARDVERIIALTPRMLGTQPRQTVLASATMPEWVQRMVQRHLLEPIRVAVAGDQRPLVEHGLVEVVRADRLRILSGLLGRQSGSAIVFHRTKHGVRKLSRDLARLGHRSTELQGNLSQNARDRAIADFRSLQSDVLVATNVAARGLDIDHVRLVVNYELPESARWLTHRIGRTARNGATGRALTFLAEDDLDQWGKLRRDGAPDLPWVDLEMLVTTGTLQVVAGPVAATAVPHARRAAAGGRVLPKRITARVDERSRRAGADGGWKPSIHAVPPRLSGATPATRSGSSDRPGRGRRRRRPPTPA